MSRIFNVAVVGCGIGGAHISEGYATNPDKYRVQALCDLDPARMAPIAKEFGIRDCVTDFDSLLIRDDIDIIDICTPPMLHFPMVMAALKAGKHVICEKPLVGSLAQVDAVMAQEKVSKGLLMPIFQYRFANGIQQVKAIIDAGIAGKPFVGTVETMWRREADYYEIPWRGKWATELGGVLMTHAIHQHDLFTYLMGDVTRLFGRVTTRVNPIEVEDCVTASVALVSGALGSFTATLGAAEEISRLFLTFENVCFESDYEAYNPGANPWRILPRNPETAAQIKDLLKDWKPQPSRFENQMARFYETLMGRAPLPVTSAESRRALEIVTAFYHSSLHHVDVQLPITSDHPCYETWVPAAFREVA